VTPAVPDDATTSTAIAVEHLTVRFGSLTVLDDVSFTASAGSSVAVIGPNGSGKTTLLNALVGLVEPTSGTVTVDHGPRTAPTAYVLQHRQGSAQRWLPLTVREVIRMGCYRGRPVGPLPRDQRRRVVEAASRLEVDDLLTRPFGELSGGQQQRVLLAQALVQQPSVLLLDEPITGLDLASQQRILDLIEEETTRGTTVVLTTHHLDEARHCDQVLLIAGRLIATGPPDQVLTAAELRRAFGPRVLGDHHAHDHRRELLIVDDHAHGAEP
jgi:manganese transport system ATP-binding protein